MALAANNTFTSGVTVNAGILAAAGNANALGTGTSTLTLAGGTLDLNHTAALAFNRPTTVTGDSTIVSEKNVAGNGVNYTLGTLSIGGGNTLGVNGGNVTGGTAGLIFGATTFTGDATFNIANPVGGGATLLTLGALNDGGVARTITKSGVAALTLATAATSIVNGTQFNIAAGTLNSNQATALGTLATVDVADGAVFNVGASQTIGALSNTTAILNSGSVTIGSGFVLTLGSTNNLNASFGGVISGSGGIAKGGSGRQTLTGINSYTGPTNVQSGVLALAGGNNRLATSGPASYVVTLGSGTSSGKLALGGAGGPVSQTFNQTTSTGILVTSGSGNANSVVGGADNGGNPANNSILTLNIGAGFTDTYNGLIGGPGTFENNINLVKSGGGILVLSGDLTNWTGTGSGPSDPTRPTLTLSGGVLRLTNTAVLNTAIFNTGGLIDDQGYIQGPNFSLTTTGGLITLNALTDSFSSVGITPASHGVVALNFNNTGVADFAASDMYLGAVGARLYSGTTLAAGAVDATATPAYRFGGGAPWAALGTATAGGSGGYLQITAANVVTGANNVIIGDNGSYNGGSGLFGGNSTVEFTAAQNYTGTTLLAGGTLVVSNVNQLGNPTTPAGSIIFDGGIFRYSGNNADISARATIAGGGVIDTNGQNVTFAAGIGNSNTGTSGSSNGGLAKIGAGTLTLTGANTYAGTTTVAGGTLQLNGNTGSLATTSGLTFAGTGTFRFDNTGAAGPTSQTLGALNFAAGDGTILSQRTAAQSTTLSFGSFARSSGATGNFTVAGTGSSASVDQVSFTAPPITGQFLDPGLFFGGSNYAVYDTTGFVRAIAYGTDTNAVNSSGGTTLGAVTGKDVNLQTAAVTAQTTDTINSLRISGAFNLTNVASNTLTITSGGILKAGGNATTIAGGTIQAGPTGTGELLVRSDLATDAVTISSTILTGSLTKSGLGTLTLGTATNTITGQIVVNGGTLSMDAAARYGATTGFTLDGATLAWTGAANLPKGFTLGLNGGTLNITSGGNQSIGVAGDTLKFAGFGARTLTLNSVVDRKQNFLFSIGDNGGPTSLVVSGAGDTSYMQLSGNNTYTGTTTINRGILQINAAQALPGGLGGTTLTTTNTGGGNLILAGTGVTRAVLELTAASGDFFRSLGTGFDQIQFTGNGGFSNGGTGTRIVNLGGAGAQVTWGAGGFIPTGSILDLAQSAGNSNGSTGIIDFQNAIQLGAVARTVDVSDGFSAAATGGIDAILSGNLFTTAAAGGLTKTGAGVLRVTGGNSSGTVANSPVVVSAGYLFFAGVNSILGAAGNRNVTLSAGAGVGLSGATDIQPLLDRINTASAGGAVLLDTSVAGSTAVIDMSALANITLGAYSDLGGTPIYYGGSITPNGTTYKFGAPTEASKGGQGPAASAVQRNTNLLVLTKQNVLSGANAASFNLGTFYFTNTNNFTGGVTTFTGNLSNIGIGNDAALGTGLINVTQATDFIGSLNGDHTLSNNIKTLATGNFVVTGNVADGIANPGAFTFLGNLNVTPSPTLFARAGNNATFLGDIVPASGAPTVTLNSGTFNLLTTPAGAVNKSITAISLAAATTLVIDGDRSLGLVPGAPAPDLTFAASTATLQLQPGVTSPITLSTNRNVAVATNAAWAINVAGGPVVGDSTLVIPGVVSGGGTGLFSKLGLGTLALRGQNTVALTNANGAQIFGGTLLLDYANSSVGTNMLLNTTILTLGTSANGTFGNGGTISINSNANSVAQTFAGFQFAAKDNYVVLNDNSATSSLTLNLPTAITRTAIGGTLNFQTNTAGGAIIVNSTNAGTNGIVPGATWNGADLVAATGTTLTQYNAYTALTGNTLVTNTLTNVAIDNSTSGNVTLAATGTTDINTLTFFDSLARTIDVRNGATAGTLRFGSVGMILAGSGTGPLTIGIAGSAGTLTAGGAVTNGAGEIILINNSANKMTVNSAIALNGTGVTTVVKSGTGTVALAGTNIYTGSLFLNSGILEYADGSAAGRNLGSPTAGAANIVMNGGTLRQTATNNLIYGLTFNSVSAVDVPDTVILTQTAQGMIGIAGVPGILQKTGVGTLAFAGTTDNANLSVQVQAGTLNLAKASTSAVHSVSGGAAGTALIVESGATAAITGTGGDQILDTSSVVVKSGGTFNLGTQSEAFDGLAGGGSVIGTGGTLTLGGSAASTNNQANISAYTLAAANAGMASTGLNNFSGVIGGSLAVTKFGAGTQTFGGANTYSGATTIAAGTLKLAVADALPSGSGNGDVTIVGNTVIGGLIVPGTLDLGGFNQAINGLNSTTGGIIVNTVPLNWTGSAWSATAGTNTLTIGNGDANGAFNGTLQNGLTIVPNPGTGAGTSVVGVLALTKTGAGTQTLSGVNTYTGLTTINGGTLILAGGSAIVGTNAVALADVAGAALELDYSLSLGSISGGGTSGGNINLQSNALTVGDSNNTTFGGVISGAGGSLVKQGSGGLTLGGANTYGGTTSINVGTLNLSGTGASLGGTAVSTANGATFGAFGNVSLGTTTAGTLAVAGGGNLNLQDGAVNTLTLLNTAAGNLVLGDATANAANLFYNFGTNSVDLIAAGGQKLLLNSSGARLNYNQLGSALAAGTYDLIQFGAGGTATGKVTFDGTNTTVQGGGGRTYNLVWDTGSASLAATFSSTTSKLQLSVVDNAAPAQAYWKGTQNGIWNAFGVGNVSNWLDGPAGTDPLQAPGPSTDVFFTATTATNLATTLGRDFTINSLTFTGAGTSAGTSSVTIGGANTLTVNNGITVQSGSVAHNISADVNLGGNQSWTNQSANLLTVSGNVHGSNKHLSVSGDVTISGAVQTGSGSVTKTGSGTLTLSNTNNTYSGATSVTGGVLSFAGSNSLGDGSATNTISLDGGTLQSTGTSVDLSANRTVTLGVGGGTIDVTGSDLTVSGAVTGAGSFTKTSAGLLLLSGGNTYTGATVINGGTLRLGATAALGNGTSNTASVTTASGAALDLNGFSPTALVIANLNGQLAATVGALANGTGSATYGGAIVLQSAASIGGAGNITLANSLSGTQALTKVGGGTLVLTGGTNASTTTSISAGTLQIGDGTTTGTLGSGTVTDNGALVFKRSNTYTVGNVINGSGTLTQAGTGTLVLSAANGYTGGTSVTAGTLQLGVNNALAAGGSVDLADSSGVTFDVNGKTQTIGRLTGGGATGGVTAVGAGSLTVGDGTTFSYGGTFADAGTGNLHVTGAGTHWTLTKDTAPAAYSGAVTIDAGATLQFGDGTASGNGGLGVASITDNGTLIINRTDSITYPGVVTGAGGVVKNGSGTVTVTAGQTYTGASTVNAGTLTLGSGGSLGGTDVSVANAATLQVTSSTTIGTATAGSLSIAGGGSLSLAGGGINTLTLTNNTAGVTGLTLGGSGATPSALIFDIDGINSLVDRINVAQKLNVGAAGSAAVTLNALNSVLANGTYTLINFAAGSSVFADSFTFVGGSQIFSAGNGHSYGLQLNNASTSLATQLQLIVTGTAAPTTAYWKGSIDASWSTFNGTNNTNWVDGPAGVDTLQVPGSNTDVFFTADSATNLSTTLDASFAINSLTFTGAGTSAAASGVTIAGGSGANTLTIGGGGITVNSPTAAHTISANVALGANQTWTNNSAGLFTVGGNVSGAGKNLSVAGAGNTTISGNIATGAGTLTKSGLGTLVLSGSNTYTGQTIVDNGTLIMASAAANGAIIGDAVASKSVGDIVVNNGGVLNWQNGDQVGDSATIVINAGGKVSLSGPNFTGANRHEKFFNLVNNGGTYFTGRGFTVEITDPTWSGGTNDVAGNDTYGQLIITGGNNRVWGDGGSGAGPGTLTVTTAGLSFSGAAGGVLKIASDVNAANAGRLFLQSNLIYDGTVNPGKIVNLTAVDAAGADTSVFGVQRGIVDLSAGIRTFNIADGVTSPEGHIASDMIVTADVVNGGVIKTGAGEVVLAGTTNLNQGLTINNGSVAMGGTVGTSFTLNAGGTFSPGAVAVNGGGTGAVTEGFAGVGSVNLDNSAGSSVINGGSRLVFQFKGVSVDGTTGAGTDWDLINNNVTSLLINATAANKITVDIESYITSTQLATTGNSANGFDPSQNYNWLFMTNVTLTNPTGDPAGARFAINAAGVWNGSYFDNAGVSQTGYGAFTQPNGSLGRGTFYVTQISNDLYVGYSAVPEPGSMLLAGIAALGMGAYGRRRLRRTVQRETEMQSTANETQQAAAGDEMPSA